LLFFCSTSRRPFFCFSAPPAPPTCPLSLHDALPISVTPTGWTWPSPPRGTVASSVSCPSMRSRRRTRAQVTVSPCRRSSSPDREIGRASCREMLYVTRDGGLLLCTEDE